jgi:hypothetical protein
LTFVIPLTAEQNTVISELFPSCLPRRWAMLTVVNLPLVFPTTVLGGYRLKEEHNESPE